MLRSVSGVERGTDIRQSRTCINSPNSIEQLKENMHRRVQANTTDLDGLIFFFLRHVTISSQMAIKKAFNTSVCVQVIKQ